MDPKIEIEFENASRTYQPGDDVEGRVIIISNGAAVSITEIVIRMDGKRVALINPQNPEEYYFCESRVVVLHNDELLSPDGMLEYQFEFKLPSELPSSFRASRALVAYQLVVTLRRKSDFDLTTKSPFYVNGVLKLDDPDNDSEHSEPNSNGNTVSLEIRKSKAVGCFSCFNWRMSRRYGFITKLLKSQFLPGDHIDFSVEIWNSSKSTLDKVRISLIRELRILDAGNYHTVLKEYGLISEVTGPMIPPGGKKSWKSLDEIDFRALYIPEDTPPTHLGCRKFIELNYFVQVSIHPRGLCSSILQGKIPIVIGSSPPSISVVN